MYIFHDKIRKFPQTSHNLFVFLGYLIRKKILRAQKQVRTDGKRAIEVSQYMYIVKTYRPSLLQRVTVVSQISKPLLCVEPDQTACYEHPKSRALAIYYMGRFRVWVRTRYTAKADNSIMNIFGPLLKGDHSSIKIIGVPDRRIPS